MMNFVKCFFCINWYEHIIFFLKIWYGSLAGVAQMVGALSRTPKGFLFNSRLGHIYKATNWFLSHIYVSLSLFLSLLFSLKLINTKTWYGGLHLLVFASFTLGMNTTKSWHIIIFIQCWIQFANIFGKFLQLILWVILVYSFAFCTVSVWV